MGFHTTGLLRANLQRRLLPQTALVKIEHKITKMWRSKEQGPATSFANEEIEFQEGRKIPEDTRPVGGQKLELPNSKEVRFYGQVNMTCKCHNIDVLGHGAANYMANLRYFEARICPISRIEQ